MEYIQEKIVWQVRYTKELRGMADGKIQVLAVLWGFEKTSHLIRRGMDLVFVPRPVMNMCLVQLLWHTGNNATTNSKDKMVKRTVELLCMHQ